MSSATAYIVVHPDKPESYVVELEVGKVLQIGRKPDPAGQRKLVLSMPEVSGTHAELRQTDDNWTIRDLGSTNGTRLNGDWLVPGQEYLLKNGDQIQIAQLDLRVNLPETVASKSKLSEEDDYDKTQFHIKLINATILVGDIRSFTSLMETYSAQPDMVMQAAHKVFQALNEKIREEHGQLEKIAGDAIMAYWQSGDNKLEHSLYARQACSTALKLQNVVSALSGNPEYWPFPGYTLQIDLALASGPVATGLLGSTKANPALLGDTANLAFRLEKLIADDTPADIIMEGTTYEMVKDHFAVKYLGSHRIKGRQRPVDVYRLIGTSTV